MLEPRLASFRLKFQQDCFRSICHKRARLAFCPRSKINLFSYSWFWVRMPWTWLVEWFITLSFHGMGRDVGGADSCLLSLPLPIYGSYFFSLCHANVNASKLCFEDLFSFNSCACVWQYRVGWENVHLSAGARGGQKRAPYPSELEIQAILSMGTGNWSYVLCESSVQSLSLSLLSSPSLQKLCFGKKIMFGA